jgi:hypothetical protein
MANTLFIVKDDVFKDLPSAITDAAIAEVKRLYKFITRFTIAVTEQAGFPERLDFTDSIIKLVKEDAEVTAAQNDAFRIELDNVVFSIRQNGVNVARPPLNHSAAPPDRGGVGFQQKEIVDPGNLRLIMTVTGGICSLEYAKEEVIQFATGGRTLQDIQDAVRKRIDGTPRHPGQGLGYYATHQALIDTREEMTWELMNKGWSDWPQDLQDNFALALGRLIAHEARHQYLSPHASAGLGSDGAALFGQPSFENFEKSDQADITSALNDLRRRQAGGTTHLATLPKGQPFPFS